MGDHGAVVEPLGSSCRAAVEPFVKSFVKSFVESFIGSFVEPFVEMMQSHLQRRCRAVYRDDAEPFVPTIVGRLYEQW